MVPVDEEVVSVVLEDVPVEEVPIALVAEVVPVLVALALVTEALVEDSEGMPAAPATATGTAGSVSAGKGERFFMRRFMFPWSRRCRGTSWASTAVARRRER